MARVGHRHSAPPQPALGSSYLNEKNRPQVVHVWVSEGGGANRSGKCLLIEKHGCYVPRKFRAPFGTMEDGDEKGGMDSVGKKSKLDKMR